jgi:hypothetical protein
MSWMDFIELACLLCSCGARQKVEWDTFSLMMSFEQIRALIELYNRGTTLPVRILVAVMRKDVLQTRDLVYAFLGLTTDVDYNLLDTTTKSTQDVSIDLVKHSILKDNSLDIICVGQGIRGTEADSHVPS